jgi:hypothetical protein
MSDITDKIEPLLTELLSVLDDEILNAQLCLERLNELRSAVIRRKEDELSGLLEMVKFQGDDYGLVSQRRQSIFLTMSKVLGCSADEINLTFITEKISSGSTEKIHNRQNMLRQLTERLSNEYYSTVILLNEFSRLNTMLIKSIFKSDEQPAVYNYKGKSRLDQSGGMISCRF